jgi:hypothetical protein
VSQFVCRGTSSTKGTLSHFAESSKEERTVGILRGEFATSREPSDLTEVQGRYRENFGRYKAQEG